MLFSDNLSAIYGYTWNMNSFNQEQAYIRENGRTPRLCAPTAPITSPPGYRPAINRSAYSRNVAASASRFGLT